MTKGAPTATGMPQWLKIMLLAVGLFILVAFLAEPVLVLRRRRQQARQPAGCSAGAASSPTLAQAGRALGRAGPGKRPAPARATSLADHDRLVVTRNTRDDTVYVLRPPGEDPRAILRVARLVLPEGPYAGAGRAAPHARQLANGVRKSQ